MPDDDRTLADVRGPDDDRAPDARQPADRAADHAWIDRLAVDLLPSLVAKLSATNLGEIEVREGTWKIRLRRPVDADQKYGRRATDRPSRVQPGHAGHGHAPAAVEGHRPARPSSGTLAMPTSAPMSTSAPAPSADGPSRAGGNGSRPQLVAVGPGGAAGEADGPDRPVAISPAVGYFSPLPDLRAGQRVRAGDRLGTVDVLGIPQEVVAPVDGIVGATLAETGQAVEYGQGLVVIEVAGMATAGRPGEGYFGEA